MLILQDIMMAIGKEVHFEANPKPITRFNGVDYLQTADYTSKCTPRYLSTRPSINTDGKPMHNAITLIVSISIHLQLLADLGVRHSIHTVCTVQLNHSTVF